jgi:hypothetical protein
VTPPTQRPERHEVPWRYGRYRVVVQRRVTEEEQISVECYERTVSDARASFSAIMETMLQHMIAYNERVATVHRTKVRELDRAIDLRAERLRRLDEVIEERVAWLKAKGLDTSDIPGADADGEDDAA